MRQRSFRLCSFFANDCERENFWQLLHPVHRFGLQLKASAIARMVKLVDTRDLKSLGLNRPCRFDSGSGHQKSKGYTNFEIIFGS